MRSDRSNVWWVTTGWGWSVNERHTYKWAHTHTHNHNSVDQMEFKKGTLQSTVMTDTAPVPTMPSPRPEGCAPNSRANESDNLSWYQRRPDERPRQIAHRRCKPKRKPMDSKGRSIIALGACSQWYPELNDSFIAFCRQWRWYLVVSDSMVCMCETWKYSRRS